MAHFIVCDMHGDHGSKYCSRYLGCSPHPIRVRDTDNFQGYLYNPITANIQLSLSGGQYPKDTLKQKP